MPVAWGRAVPPGGPDGFPAGAPGPGIRGTAHGAAAVPVAVPEGFRDLDPAAAARRRRLEALMLATLDAWGYAEVGPTLLEDGGRPGPDAGADGGRTGGRFRVLEPGGRLWTLRPDATEAIARMVAGPLSLRPAPLRIAYAAAVYRAEAAQSGKPRERYQVGAELIGVPEPWGDAEVVAAALDALAAVGAGPVTVGLGHAHVTRSAFETLGVAGEAVRAAMAAGDLAGLAQILGSTRLAPWQRLFFRGVARLEDPPEAVSRLRAGGTPAGVRAALDALEALVEAVDAWGLPGRIRLDLGLDRGLDYYTGPVFAFYVEGCPRAAGGGGRYDGLLRRYGRSLEATGMALEVTELMDVAGVEAGGEPRLDYLVLARAGEAGWATAADLAAALRRQGYRAAVEPAPVDLRARLDRAREAGVARVLVLGEGGYEEIALLSPAGDAGRH